MLKILLVDDEPNVRQGLKMMLPWDELEMSVIGEGEDGDDGLEKIRTLKPDIVIADIRMPGKTGLQMLEEAKKNGFSGKSLILSGYSDFSYAQEALTLGVKKFILKPVDEEEIIVALKEIKEEILKELENTDILVQGERYMNEKLLKALFLGDENIIRTADLSDYNYPHYDVALISVAVNINEKEISTDKQSKLLQSVADELQKKNDLDILTTDLSGMLAVLFKGWNRDVLTELLKKINKEYSQKVFITIGNRVKGIYMIKQSYFSANTLYKNRFLYLHHGVVSVDDEKTAKESNTAEIDNAARHIYDYIEVNDIARLESTLDNLQVVFRQNGYSPERIKVLCITIIMDIKMRISKSIGDSQTEKYLNEETINSIASMESFYKTINALKAVFSEISNNHFSNTAKSTLDKVVQYIDANYSQELKLEILAGIFGYNSAYLGKVFHQHTGESFNNYLDKIRIDEAKRLLSEGEHKVYKVAEMVGYTNVNYFHNKFKKQVGVSPMNYKKTVDF